MSQTGQQRIFFFAFNTIPMIEITVAIQPNNSMFIIRVSNQKVLIKKEDCLHPL